MTTLKPASRSRTSFRLVSLLLAALFVASVAQGAITNQALWRGSLDSNPDTDPASVQDEAEEGGKEVLYATGLDPHGFSFQVPDLPPPSWPEEQNAAEAASASSSSGANSVTHTYDEFHSNDVPVGSFYPDFTYSDGGHVWCTYNSPGYPYTSSPCVLASLYTGVIDIDSVQGFTSYEADIASGGSYGTPVTFEGSSGGVVVASTSCYSAYGANTHCSISSSAAMTHVRISGRPNYYMVDTSVFSGLGAAPQNFVAAPGPGQVVLTWDAPSNSPLPITDYKVYRGTTASSQSLLATVDSETFRYEDNDVTSGTTYYYRVSALNTHSTENSTRIVAATPGGLPTPPRDLRARLNAQNVDLHWKAPVSNGGLNLTAYRIYRSSDSGASFTFLDSTNGTTKQYSTLACVPECYYLVKAVNAFGESAASNTAATLASFASQPLESIRGTTPAAGGALKQAFPCNSPAQNSVNVVSGQFVASTCLLKVPSPYGLETVVQLTHRSHANTQGLVGHNWDASIYRRLDADEVGNIALSDGTGRQDVFTHNADGSYKSPPGLYAQLTALSAGGFRLAYSGGTMELYDETGARTEVQDAIGNTLSFSYNAVGFLSQITDPADRSILIGYERGRLASVMDPAGRTTTLAYNTAGDLIRIELPTGAVYRFTTNAQHDVVAAQDGNEDEYLSNTYDANGRVVQQTYGSGTYDFSYDEQSKQTLIRDPNGNYVTWQYQSPTFPVPSARLTSSSGLQPGGPASTLTRFAFNSNLEPTLVVLQDGRSQRYTYDDANADARMRGNVLEYRETSSTGSALVTSYMYETAFQLLRTQTDPLGHTSTYWYGHDEAMEGDLNGDGLNGPSGRVVRIDHPVIHTPSGDAQFSETFRYNEHGQITRHRDVDGSVTSFAYDPSGFMRATSGYPNRVTLPASSGGGSFGPSILSAITEGTLDESGNATTSFTYDAAGNVASVTDALNHTSTWTYDELGRVLAHTDALGIQTTSTYDAAGNLVRKEMTNAVQQLDGTFLVDSLHPFSVESMQYDELGRVAQKWLDANRTTGAPSTVQPTTLREEFVYDPNGNLVLHKRNGKLNGTSTNDVETFIYDAQNRLVSTTTGGRSPQFSLLPANQGVDVSSITDPFALYLHARQVVPALPVEVRLDAGDSGSSVTASLHPLGQPSLPATTFCSSEEVGVGVDGEPRCIASPVASCPSGDLGASVDGQGACSPPPATCPDNQVGIVLGEQTMCTQMPSTCPEGSVGVILNGEPQCFTPPVEPCSANQVGVIVNGQGACADSPLSCPAGQIGAMVNGQGACIPSPLTGVCLPVGGFQFCVLPGPSWTCVVAVVQTGCVISYINSSCLKVPPATGSFCYSSQHCVLTSVATACALTYTSSQGQCLATSLSTQVTCASTYTNPACLTAPSSGPTCVSSYSCVLVQGAGGCELTSSNQDCVLSNVAACVLLVANPSCLKVPPTTGPLCYSSSVCIIAVTAACETTYTGSQGECATVNNMGPVCVAVLENPTVNPACITIPPAPTTGPTCYSTYECLVSPAYVCAYTYTGNQGECVASLLGPMACASTSNNPACLSAPSSAPTCTSASACITGAVGAYACASNSNKMECVLAAAVVAGGGECVFQQPLTACVFAPSAICVSNPVVNCPSNQVGLIVNGVNLCQTPPTGPCSAGQVGFVVGGQRACVTPPPATCPNDPSSPVVAGQPLCAPPSAAPCSGNQVGNQVGVIVNGQPNCFTPPVASCAGNQVGLVVNGQAHCVTPPVAPCAANQVGVIVNGVPACATIGSCPTGQVGAYINGLPACIPSPLNGVCIPIVGQPFCVPPGPSWQCLVVAGQVGCVLTYDNPACGSAPPSAPTCYSRYACALTTPGAVVYNCAYTGNKGTCIQTLLPAGLTGCVMKQPLGVCVTVGAGTPTCVNPPVAPCPEGQVGLVANGQNLCQAPPVGPCPSEEVGLVVNGEDVCLAPPVAPCPSGQVGLMVNGEQVCQTPPSVGPCPAGQVGIIVGTEPLCLAPPVEPCPAGEIGLVVNGEPLCQAPPVVGQCEAEEVGVVVNDQVLCFTPPVGSCPEGEVGAIINGEDACTPPPVAICPGSQVGAVLNGQAACTPLPSTIGNPGVAAYPSGTGITLPGVWMPIALPSFGVEAGNPGSILGLHAQGPVGPVDAVVPVNPAASGFTMDPTPSLSNDTKASPSPEAEPATSSNTTLAWEWAPELPYSFSDVLAQAVIWAQQTDQAAGTPNAWSARLYSDGELVASSAGALFPAATNGTIREYRLNLGTVSLTGSRLRLEIDPGSSPSGRFVLFDSKSALSRLELGKAVTTTRAYDANGNLVMEADGNGVQTTHAYDAYGRQSGTATATRRTESTLDDLGRVVATKTYGALGGLGWQTPTQGEVLLQATSRQFDEAGRVVRQDEAFFDPATGAPIGDGAATTTWEHDAAGHVTKQTDDNGAQHLYAYDGRGQIVSETDEEGNEVHYTYDLLGNLVNRTSLDIEHTSTGTVVVAHTILYAYNARGERIRETDELGNTKYYGYDAAGRLAWQSDARGALIADPLGLFAGQINDVGNLVRYFYDNQGRLVGTERELRAGGVGNGALVGTVLTTQDWDGDGHLVKQVDGTGAATTYTYDAEGRRTRETYADGSHTDYWHDGVGNIVATTKPDGTVIKQDYDSENLLVRRTTTGASSSQFFEYDSLGRLTKATDSNGPGASDDSELVFAYDSLGHRTLQRQDGHSVTASFDGLGNALQLTYPNGRSVSKQYDDLNRLTTASDSTGTLASFTYDGAGRTHSRLAGNGVTTTYSYDAALRVSSILHDVEDLDRAFQSDYAYDRNGNQASEVLRQAPEWSRQVSYDSIGRLVALGRSNFQNLATVSSPIVDILPTSMDWNLNAAGDWLQANQTWSSTTINEERTHNSLHELEFIDTGSEVQDFVHDANGNRASDGAYNYTWDAYNRLRTVTDAATGDPIASYTYDALNRRVTKTAGTDTTHFLYDEENVIEERNATGVVLRQFVHGQATDQPLVVDCNTDGDATATGAGDARYSYLQDALGSVVGLTDSAGTVVEAYLYDAYGAAVVLTPDTNSFVNWTTEDDLTTASVLGNPYAFTGQRLDSETGLMYYRARYYDTAAGRFLSRDPVGVWGDKVNLGNAYAYVADNPLTNTDPMGAYCWNIFSGDCWRENARDLGSDLKNGATIVGNAAIQGTTTAVNAVVKGAKDTYHYVQDHCFSNWGDAGKCALIGASAVVLVVATGGAAVPAWAIGAATAVAFTTAVDCADGRCLTDSWQSYAGSAVAGGAFGAAPQSLNLFGRVAWGAGSGVFGNSIDQTTSILWGGQGDWNVEQSAWALGLGGLGGGLSKIPTLNMGSHNFLGRAEGVFNKGQTFGWKSYRNTVLGVGIPEFLGDGLTDIVDKSRAGGDWQR